MNGNSARVVDVSIALLARTSLWRLGVRCRRPLRAFPLTSDKRSSFQLEQTHRQPLPTNRFTETDRQDRQTHTNC